MELISFDVQIESRWKQNNDFFPPFNTSHLILSNGCRVTFGNRSKKQSISKNVNIQIAMYAYVCVHKTNQQIL